jgi:hypothetical protein
VLSPGRARADHTNGFAIEAAGADQLVERVLDRTSDSAGVLGSRYERDICDLDQVAPILDNSDVFAVAISVERGTSLKASKSSMVARRRVTTQRRSPTGSPNVFAGSRTP